MPIRLVDLKDKKEFNSIASHPLQSWEWGEFRKQSGVDLVRLGNYEKGKLLEAIQMTIHDLPFGRKIGYVPKSLIPDSLLLTELMRIGREKNLIFIKFEPNIRSAELHNYPSIKKFPFVKSAHPLFTQYTFQLDLTADESDLLKNLHQKTRYNIKIARKHNVIIKEDHSSEAFRAYLTLTFETTRRQKFYAHDEKYHTLMWNTMHKAGIAHLFTAEAETDGNKKILAAWILFLFNNILYYPYGASSSLYRNFMASNLLMWEAIRFGQKHKAKSFDLWGSLGPNADEKDSWYGFHRFKQGYNPELVELAGSYDLILNKSLYRMYNGAYRMRKIFLNLKAEINR